MVPILALELKAWVDPQDISMQYSLLSILLLFVANVVVHYFREASEKQALTEIFSQYAPPEVVARIVKQPASLSMDVEAREMTMMFCDVHNFTTISESLEPRELADLLNTLLSPLSRTLYENNGVIDKYLGDGIMAFWGAPVSNPHHAANAVAAAFEMQDRLLAMGPEFRARGWPEIRMGIGINTGIVSVGNMGSQYRMAYTVIGDAVNLAARLQDLTRVYHTKIIVGESTRNAFPAANYRELGLVQVKGKTPSPEFSSPATPQRIQKVLSLRT